METETEMDTLNMMPDDVLLAIFDGLNDTELCSARAVCQLWNTLICEPYLWRKRFAQRWGFVPRGDDEPHSWMAHYAARRGTELRMRGGRAQHYRVTTTRLASPVLALDDAPAGAAVAVAVVRGDDGDAVAHTVPLASGVDPLAAPQRVCGAAERFALAPTGGRVAVRSERGDDVHVPATGAALHHTVDVLDMQWHRDGAPLLTHTARVVSVWAVEQGRRAGVRVFEHVALARWCAHVDDALFVASGDGLVGVYECTGELVPRWEVQLGARARRAVLHESGMCVLGMEDGSLTFVDVAAQRVCAAGVAVEGGASACVAFQDERTLVMPRGHVLHAVDAHTGAVRVLAALPRNDAQPLVVNALFADADRIVAGCSDHAVHVCVRGDDSGAWQHRYVLLGGSRQRRVRHAHEHPTRRGCSFVRVDASRVLACFGSVVRVYTFT